MGGGRKEGGKGEGHELWKLVKGVGVDVKGGGGMVWRAVRCRR